MVPDIPTTRYDARHKERSKKQKAHLELMGFLKVSRLKAEGSSIKTTTLLNLQPSVFSL